MSRTGQGVGSPERSTWPKTTGLPFFNWLGGDQERNLVQQNALAFWTPKAPRRGENRSKPIRINPAPATKKVRRPPLLGPANFFARRGQGLALRGKQVHSQPQRRESVALSGKSN